MDNFKSWLEVFTQDSILEIADRTDISTSDMKRSKKEHKGATFADTKNKRYPIDKGHIHAAISYFAMPKNYSFYSESDRKIIARKILSAATKFGVVVSDEWKSKFGLK